MKDNLVFILISFLLIVTVLVYFPNQKNKKLRIKKNEKIIQVEQDKDYAAVVTQDTNSKTLFNSVENNMLISPVDSDTLQNDTEFKISNIKILDLESQEKDIFVFNETLKIVFDYQLPEGFYTFKLETIPAIDINLTDDILRQGKGNTNDKPLSFSVKSSYNLDDIKINKINILVFHTDDYNIPKYNQVVDTNITIKNLNINLIREDDYTTPLILGNT